MRNATIATPTSPHSTNWQVVVLVSVRRVLLCPANNTHRPPSCFGLEHWRACLASAQRRRWKQYSPPLPENTLVRVVRISPRRLCCFVASVAQQHVNLWHRHTLHHSHKSMSIYQLAFTLFLFAHAQLQMNMMNTMTKKKNRFLVLQPLNVNAVWLEPFAALFSFSLSIVGCHSSICHRIFCQHTK